MIWNAAKIYSLHPEELLYSTLKLWSQWNKSDTNIQKRKKLSKLYTTLQYNLRYSKEDNWICKSTLK